MGMTRQAVRLAAAVTVVAVAAGCSSKAPTPSPQPTGPASAVATTSPAASAPVQVAPDSCNVITTAQASAALGQPVKPPRRGKATVEGGVACVFYGPDAPPGVSPDIPIADTVRVVLVTGPNARKWFEGYRRKVKAQPISGLGDQAYYDGYASISVLKGDEYVRIAVGTANNLGPEKTLARDAVARM
jgi:lipopolysaccharide export system protein LptA